MDQKEIVRKIRHIQIRASRLVNDILAGEYHSVFKGRGIEFDEVREYQAGDDIRAIDWNVTARTGRPFIKKFVEERELTVMLLVDASASQIFGTKHQMKKEMAAEISALLAFSAIKNNDKVGMIIFSDRIEKYIPPKKGKKHVLRVIRESLCHESQGQGTDLTQALQFMNSVVKRKAVCFLVSDFISADYERALKITKRRHDLIGVMLEDRREKELPQMGLVRFLDPETGEEVMVDTGDAETRKKFSAQSKKDKREKETLFKSSDVDYLCVETGSSYIESFIRFFRQRERKIALRS